MPDMLIADKGSNAVTTLLGSYDVNGYWQGTPGPRLASGGAGPIDANPRILPGQSIASLVVTDAQSGSISVLAGRGQGFFADGTPRVLNLPGNPVLTAGPVVFSNSISGWC